jgi:hypothetical protein
MSSWAENKQKLKNKPTVSAYILRYKLRRKIARYVDGPPPRAMSTGEKK